MAILENKIDFIAIISATMANPNGDPLNGNRPRTNYDGIGEMTDVCVKRKIRNRMQDMGKSVFVQMQERSDDGFASLEERAEMLGKEPEDIFKGACAKWLDVRSFGQVFAISSSKNKKAKKKTTDDEPMSDESNGGISVGVRGPVSIHQSASISPVDMCSFKITKSVNGATTEDGKKAKDTMGDKHMVRFGLYKIKGSINVQLAQKTKFTDEDAACIKECLRTLFENDTSSARPEGSMEVIKLYRWQHNCPTGQYSTAKVHRSLAVTLKEGVEIPSSVDDYTFEITPLDGLTPEIIEGL